MAYDLSNVRVLIVDLSPFRRTLFCDVLKAIGIEKFEALGDGTTAYSLFRSVPFDIVITEQTMVPLDGLDLTVMIRTNPDSPNTVVPILMVTGAPSVEDVVAARDSGATEYMVMPFSVTSLYRRLTAIIENPRQFVQQNDYFGPDRRRTITDFLGDDQRVSED